MQRQILLCLDDLWEELPEMELSFVDVEVGSKVLISTRMKGRLVGAHQVDVGLPSASDSARMLLAAAGSGADSEQSAPKGVSEMYCSGKHIRCNIQIRYMYVCTCLFCVKFTLSDLYFAV